MIHLVVNVLPLPLSIRFFRRELTQTDLHDHYLMHMPSFHQGSLQAISRQPSQAKAVKQTSITRENVHL